MLAQPHFLRSSWSHGNPLRIPLYGTFPPRDKIMRPTPLLTLDVVAASPTLTQLLVTKQAERKGGGSLQGDSSRGRPAAGRRQQTTVRSSAQRTHPFALSSQPA